MSIFSAAFFNTLLGAYDLWAADRPDRQADWGPAVNLGPIINTTATEVGPSLFVDEHWLFFGSAGHGGFGSTDVFASYRDDLSDILGWQKPIKCEFRVS